MIKFFLNDWIKNFLEKEPMNQTREDSILFALALICYFVLLSFLVYMSYRFGKAIKEYNERTENEDEKRTGKNNKS